MDTPVYSFPYIPMLRVLGHAGAVVLRAAVSHTSYALVPRLGVDIPFTHSPQTRHKRAVGFQLQDAAWVGRG